MPWDAANAIGSFAPKPELLNAFAAPVTRSTEQALLAFTELGITYSELKFTLRNHDGTNGAVFYIDESESGIAPDEEREAVLVGPGMERSITFRNVLTRYFGLSAAGNPDAGFPSVQVSWQIVGFRRLGK